jgi:hypothetical protein
MGVFEIAGLLPTNKFGKRTNWTSRGSSAQIREDREGPWMNSAEGTGVYHASRTTFSVFTVHKYAKSKSALYSYVFLRQFSVSVKFLAW